MKLSNRKDIIGMAEKAGVKFDPLWGIASHTGTATFERFFQLAYEANAAARRAIVMAAAEIGRTML
jgi:hypothetical protein